MADNIVVVVACMGILACMDNDLKTLLEIVKNQQLA